MPDEARRRRVREEPLSRPPPDREARHRGADPGLLHLLAVAAARSSTRGCSSPRACRSSIPICSDERFESRVAIFHQRYSTNTFPQWWLAQPFRCLAHNGEINTIRGNKNWMLSHEIKMASLAFGEHSRGHQAGDPGGRVRHRRARRGVRGDLPLGPRRADRQADAGARGLAAERRHAAERTATCTSISPRVMEPWDGPAALAMTDGRWAVAGMDRNALRPLRYTLTADGLLIVGSETRHGRGARSDHHRQGPARAGPDDRGRSRRGRAARRPRDQGPDRRRGRLCRDDRQFPHDRRSARRRRRDACRASTAPN